MLIGEGKRLVGNGGCQRMSLISWPSQYSNFLFSLFAIFASCFFSFNCCFLVFFCLFLLLIQSFFSPQLSFLPPTALASFPPLFPTLSLSYIFSLSLSLILCFSQHLFSSFPIITCSVFLPFLPCFCLLLQFLEDLLFVL